MSLSTSTIETVKLTVPELKEYADDITVTMYDILFENYPETKSLFKGAPEDQPKVLSAAVTAYAMNIDNLLNCFKNRFICFNNLVNIILYVLLVYFLYFY